MHKVIKFNQEAWLEPYIDMNTKLRTEAKNGFIINIKTEDFYEDISDDVETRFNTSNYEVNRPLPTGKNKKVIGLMKDELGGNIMTKFVSLIPTTYSNLMDDDSADKKSKGTKENV